MQRTFSSRLARLFTAALCCTPGFLSGAPGEAAQPAPAAMPADPTAPAVQPLVEDEEFATADDAPDETAEPVVADDAEPGAVDEAEPAAAADPTADDAAAAEPPVTPAWENAARESAQPTGPTPDLPPAERLTPKEVPAVDAAPLKEPAEEAVPPPAAVPDGASVADEEGVLPGEPDDEPGVGLPADAAAESESQPAMQGTIFLLGSEVPPGAIDWLSWSASESFEGISTPTPILIVNGRRPGPTLCLTAAVHGDELNGVEMVRRIMYSLDPEKLNGAVIGAPIVNLHGFRRSSRYLPDRRDLNRYFPGSPTGSSASRIAHSFFHEIIVHCDALVDVHTGSFHRANLPQLRADLNIPEVVELTKGFGATVVLHSRGTRGTLRRAATDKDIPAVTLETGEPMRLQPKEVAHGVKGIETLLDKLGMVKKASLWGDPQPVYYEARWIRANTGGILFSNVNLGERVRKDEVLGTVTDPITNKRSQIVSPWEGRIIGRALNQVVMPGFAAFHVGIQTSEDEIQEDPTGVATASAADEESEDGEAEGAARAEESAPPSDAGDEQGEDPEYLEEDERPE